ncbi:uncharacterized protein PV09_08628 [Verruconis gallopava]|uniref:Xaa-Pro dipeptidyl-peptidase C-terminal domain-containing protein n=1 Tax=Verruconis gallopava TaxID=253628 RepID=A0A0D1XBU1_9PEZI|nr:uncharacterized protein PV09_08628 [Verruconis gallopava]KIV99695.1 hypothetical protein PV09_08628 [Verruconis gallopava]
MPPPVQVAIKRVQPPKIGENGYVGFKPGQVDIYRAGSTPKFADALSLTSDIIVEHDVEVVMRDGARLYIDIYRPANTDAKVPAILSWSFYGKKYSALDMLPMTTWGCCVKRSDLSGLEKFEGLDPQYWCPKNYAIISVDTRGAGNSDGQICVMGTQDAEDGYDVVEAVAKMSWCNGAVGMAGNSALAISQWFIAAQQPPSLKAIAPWEGSGDLFREQFCRGGWFTMSNFDLIGKAIVRGQENSGLEDFEEMYRRSNISNAYWEDKRVDMTKIQCPAYIRGSDLSSIHTMGSIRGYLEIPHSHKWIQWSSYQEWYELYSVPESNVELGKFFDRYLKGIENDWEKTPKVRWSVLRFGDREAIDNIVLEDFPSPTTTYRQFYLHDGQLKTENQEYKIATYNSEDYKDFAVFDYTFDEPARLIGLPKAILYMSCDARDDFTTFIILRKKDKNGKLLMHLQFPFAATPVKSIDEIPEKEQSSTNLFLGSVGILRASHRAIDPSRSMHPQFPFHPHTKKEMVPAGTIIRMEIGIWAMSVQFDAGETLSMRIGGQFPSIAEYKSFSGPRPEHELNRGQHKIHCGGDYPSSIILPFI